jgi:two-component system sensor histidine kinase KdpD
MFVVALVISKLTLRVREQANAARLRERRTAALYNLSKELVHEQEVKTLCSIAEKHISEVFPARSSSYA